MKIPEKINILSTEFSVEICEKPSDVSGDGRDAQWGNIDYWNSEMRLYKHKSKEQIFKSFIHEIVHGVITELRITEISKLDRYEDIVESFSSVFVDTLIRNNLLKG